MSNTADSNGEYGSVRSHLFADANGKINIVGRIALALFVEKRDKHIERWIRRYPDNSDDAKKRIKELVEDFDKNQTDPEKIEEYKEKASEIIQNFNFSLIQEEFKNYLDAYFSKIAALNNKRPFLHKTRAILFNVLCSIVSSLVIAILAPLFFFIMVMVVDVFDMKTAVLNTAKFAECTLEDRKDDTNEKKDCWKILTRSSSASSQATPKPESKN